MTKGVDIQALSSFLERVEAGDEGDELVQWLIARQGQISDFDGEQGLLVVEAARRMGLAERLQAAKSEGGKAVRKAAGRALHSLRSQGQALPEPERKQAAWSMKPETVDVPGPAALLGLPQSDGYFPFILVATSRQGACVCAGVAGAGRGFQDADHAHVSRSDAKDVIDKARRDHALVELPFHTVLHLTERAFAEGGQGVPHGWGHMLESVPEATRTSASVLDPLQRQSDTLDLKALAEIEPLLEGNSRIVFGLDEAASGPAVDECVTALSSPILSSTGDRHSRIAGIVRVAATEALTEVARRSWILAMDVTAVVASAQDNESLRVAARQTGLALRAGMAGGDIPFFNVWVERQLAAVSQMVMSIREEKSADGA